VKREGEVWEIINRERGRRGRINEGIDMEEWKEYFMGLLGGVEGRVVLGVRFVKIILPKKDFYCLFLTIFTFNCNSYNFNYLQFAYN